MALTRIFGGTTLYVPGAYTTKNVILTGGQPSVAVGKVAIIGESSNGAPGSTGIMQFAPEALSVLIAMYGSGPIVDAARQLVEPSNDERITSGASAIYVYKTNASTKSSLALATSFGTLSSQDYGQTANLISVEIDKQNAIDAVANSSATFDSTTALTAGLEFTLRTNGGVINTFTMPSGVVTRAELVTALTTGGNWTGGVPAGVSFSTSGSSDALAILTIALSPLSTDNRLGYGRDFELIAGSPDLLTVVHMTPGLVVSQLEPQIRLLMQRALDNSLEDTNNNGGDIGGNIYLEVGYQGVSGTLTINASQVITTVVGGSGASLVLPLANYTTINDLAAYIDAQPGYTATVPATVNGGLNPSVLDKVTTVGIASTGVDVMPGRIKADYYTIYAYILSNSSLTTLPAPGATSVGLPDAISTTFLSGAVRGASASSDFVAGLSALESVDDVDIIIPLVSQDASNDITENSAYTDPSSSYQVASILAATNTHCNLMSNTQNRKERVSYLGFRGTISQCEAQSLSLNSAFCSLLIQDVEVVNVQGNLQFFQPHIAASLAAGMQAGADIGQPTTHKDIQATAIKHVGQAGVPLAPANLFDPKTDLNIAIAKGIFPLNNPSNGGIQIVVQNSTYSKDANFVYNRPSVFSAMNYMAKVTRQLLEDEFVGEKNKTSTKESVLTEVQAIMADFLRSDIIVGDDSNNGLGFKQLSIRVDGNALFLDITITPVQGIDFILANMNFDNIRIAA